MFLGRRISPAFFMLGFVATLLILHRRQRTSMALPGLAPLEQTPPSPWASWALHLQAQAPRPPPPSSPPPLRSQAPKEEGGRKKGPLLLIAILSARSNTQRRQLMRQSLVEQRGEFLAAAGPSVRAVFVVGAACPIPVHSRRKPTRCPDMGRCGEHTCEWADAAKRADHSLPAPERAVEATLDKEAAKHRDLARVDTVDEYTRAQPPTRGRPP